MSPEVLIHRRLGIVVCETLKDGRNNILVDLRHRQTRFDLDAAPPVSLIPSLGSALHGETVYDVGMIQTTHCTTWVLSGSEDCAAALSRFQHGKHIETRILPPHETCVRAVCCVRGRHTMLLVTCGGKLSSQFFRLDVPMAPSVQRQDITRERIRFLGKGSVPGTKQEIDQRFNCVKAVALATDQGDCFIVLAGDSNGRLHYFVVDSNIDDARQSSTVMCRTIFTASRPILTIQIVQLNEGLLGILGTTGGDIIVVQIPTQDCSDAEMEVKELSTFQAHEMGTNSISAVQTMTVQGERAKVVTLRLCSGGDDQRLCLGTLEVEISNGEKLWSIKRQEIRRTGEVSASALKGVGFMGGPSQVAVVGYSQKLALYDVNDDLSVVLVSVADVDVGDVNCIATNNDTFFSGSDGGNCCNRWR